MSSSKTIVLITGANQGIGLETSAALGETSSAYHIIIGSRSLEKGEAALSDLKGRQLKGSFSLVQLDVTDTESISKAVQSVEKEFGRLDVLINNAGITVRDESTLLGELRKTFETNTFGAAATTEAFLPLLKKKESDNDQPRRLIYVSSDLGSIGMRSDPANRYYELDGTAYRVSKAAMNMLAVCHQKELGQFGIKVWAFNPGFVATNLSGQSREAVIKRGAGDPKVSAQDLVQVVEGKRDADAGKFVHGEAGDQGQGGIHPW